MGKNWGEHANCHYEKLVCCEDIEQQETRQMTHKAVAVSAQFACRYTDNI